MEAGMQEGCDAGRRSDLGKSLPGRAVDRHRGAPGQPAGEAAFRESGVPGRKLCANRRPDAVGSDQQTGCNRHGFAFGLDRRGHASRVCGDACHPCAGNELDIGPIRHFLRQGRLQVGAVRHQIGRAPALLGRLSKRHARQLAQAFGILQHHRFGPDRVGQQAVQCAKPAQDAGRVRRQLEAGAGRLELLGLLEQSHRQAALGEGKCRRQPGYTCPGYDDLPGPCFSHGRGKGSGSLIDI